MKTKFIFCLLSFILFISCKPEVLDNERWVIQGKLTDTSGNSLEDIKLSSQVGTYQLGKNFTDKEGDFKLTSLGTDRNHLKVMVNSGINLKDPDRQKAWSSIVFHFEGIENFKPDFELGDIQLYPAAVLNLKIQADSSSDEDLWFNVKYPSTIYHETISLEQNPDMGFEADTGFSRTVKAGDSFEQEFYSLLNSEVILIYRIGNGVETQITIPLNETENTYVLNY